MASFYIPLSGLNADSTALNTIANDLSNMNTTAFKSKTTNFSDLFYQQVATSGSGDAIQVGGGTQVAANETDFTQGAIDSTGVDTDAALNGNGFFILNDGGSNVLSRAGDFSLASNGNLMTSDGLNVMGYPAVNGVVNTNAALTAINIPENQVQPPQATTTFGMTATLDSAAAVGTSVPGQVEVYDSLGNSYEATVTYTKTGTNAWSYAITAPDTLPAAPATAAAATTMAVTPATAPGTTTLNNTLTAATPATAVAPVTQSTSAAGGVTTLSYNLSTVAGTLGTIDENTTSLTITGPGGAGTVTVPPPGANETAFQYAGDITTAMGIANMTVGAGGVTVTGDAATGQLSFAGTTGAFTVTGNMNQDVAGTTNNFKFNTGGTVDPELTDLTISGQTAAGVPATITAPTVTSGESITTYATALTNLLSAKGIVNVTVTPDAATGQLSIVGANMATAGTVSQDLAATTTNYDFGSSATVDPSLTNLIISGQTATGAIVPIAAPMITANETGGEYAAALPAKVQAAGIVGVSVNATGGQLSITGANITTTGSVSQDLSATTISYDFGASAGNVATVDPATNLTITGQTTSGATATITAPTVTSGETVAEYVTALTSALDTAGIAGVAVSSTAAGKLSIVGAGITTTGSLIQDPVASANATGTLTFNSNGNLASPATDVSNISFTGLADGAAPMNMTWDILGASGAPTISQVDATSAVSATTQNGYASGNYQSFAIGSDGTVTATYSNGQNQAVGQLALANVANLQGLQDLGNSEYATTLASGTASIGTSGTNGLGTLTGGAIEESNVNISTEFSDLIIAQRAFEANSKAITTFDTLTQETINMIH